ncbi:formate--tetrahydrofolate ligase [Geomicrobium sp. JCM 19055]|uniref:formate--tetrahydrofolate ligase n=1 Tax=Geomicrobium sp. JCM 19055 TaxID=1460649 RepID=UPI00045ED5D5|nr:formate--tetrahydrofolate ligase [Geomicrobium sp. JCM 19055]GAK00434.1 formate-tetrahydrofolate ligase [Geomicrobium sp. JCM 19055]
MANTDIEIAQRANMLPIEEVANRLTIQSEQLELYGKYKAKLADDVIDPSNDDQDGKLILVSAITPTPAGEGKTTTTVGLGDALNQLGKKAVIALREPSLGPVFGMKGGAAGGGHSQAVPMEEINLHFTGDMHAIGAANNLLAALIDNHIYQGNELSIDPKTITWKRCLDMNDRQLRNIVSGLQGSTNGVPREDGFDITVASEIMAILCLASDRGDLKKRLQEIVIGFTYEKKAVTAGDLKAEGALATILKDAFNPNLVQTLENNPVIIHGGPFANIAHGCNSVIATKAALKLGDYAVTEAGFGADLGAEKFVNIKCRQSGLRPSAGVLVATVRALKMHGGVKKEDLAEENLGAIEKGIANLKRHFNNMQEVYRIPTVVSINQFPTDTEEELALVQSLCEQAGIQAIRSTGWRDGGKGVINLAKAVVNLSEEQESTVTFTYNDDESLEEKVKAVVTTVYRGSGIQLSKKAKTKLREYEQLGYIQLPVCIAKTQYSFSDDINLGSTPEAFTVQVRDVKLNSGSRFIVVVTGAILTMPGLPKKPAAENIDVDEKGVISGLF